MGKINAINLCSSIFMSFIDDTHDDLPNKDMFFSLIFKFAKC